MIIKKGDYEKLNLEKGAEKIGVMFSTIFGFMGDIERQTSGGGAGYDYKKMEDKKEKLTGDIYADKIVLTFSGNEPRVFARVIDNVGREIYYCDYWADSPEAVSIVASVARVFMDAFNKYMYFNFD